MPRYTYKCTKCEESTERVHSLFDESEQFCGNCGGTLKKTYQPTPAIFKGDGWGKQNKRT